MLQRQPRTTSENVCACLFVLWAIFLCCLKIALEATFSGIGRSAAGGQVNCKSELLVAHGIYSSNKKRLISSDQILIGMVYSLPETPNDIEMKSYHHGTAVHVDQLRTPIYVRFNDHCGKYWFLSDYQYCQALMEKYLINFHWFCETILWIMLLSIALGVIIRCAGFHTWFTTISFMVFALLLTHGILGIIDKKFVVHGMALEQCALDFQASMCMCPLSELEYDYDPTSKNKKKVAMACHKYCLNTLPNSYDCHFYRGSETYHDHQAFLQCDYIQGVQAAEVDFCSNNMDSGISIDTSLSTCDTEVAQTSKFKQHKYIGTHVGLITYKNRASPYRIKTDGARVAWTSLMLRGLETITQNISITTDFTLVHMHLLVVAIAGVGMYLYHVYIKSRSNVVNATNYQPFMMDNHRKRRKHKRRK